MSAPNYPLDLTAAAPSNHVTGEVHIITSEQSRFFVPVAGPFFTQTLILRNNFTNEILLPNNDFKILHHHHQASETSGKNVCAIIYITNQLIPSVNLEYQCVGGAYSDTSDIIRQLILDHPLDPDQPQAIAWGQVFGQPYQYPPAAHLHSANQFLGYGDLVSAIEQLRVAVASGDNMAMAAVYRYVELVINNTNYLSADDLNGLLNVPDTFVKVYPTYASLRDIDNFVDNLPIIYIAMGRDISSDDRPMIFRWAPTNIDVDNNNTIIKPNHISVNQPGRLVSIRWVENTMAPVLKQMGRILEQNGTVNTHIAEINHVGAGNDLDDITLYGLHWVNSTMLHMPPNVEDGMMYVENATENYIFQWIIGGRDIVEFSPGYHDSGLHVRTGLRTVNTDSFVWTSWVSSLSKTRGRVYGIDAIISESNMAESDLNDNIHGGMYYVGAGHAHSDFEHAVLEVVEVSSTEVIQTMYNRLNHGVRAGVKNVSTGVYTWDGWMRRVTSDALQMGDATGMDIDALPFRFAGIWAFTNLIHAPHPGPGYVEVKTAGVKIYQNITFDDGTVSNRVFDGISWSLWRDIKGFPVNVPPNASGVPAGITDIDNLWVEGVYLLGRNELTNIPESIGITATYVLTVITPGGNPNAYDNIQLITALDSGMSTGRMRRNLNLTGHEWGVISPVPYSIRGSSQIPPLIGNTYVEIYVGGTEYVSYDSFSTFKLTDRTTSETLDFDTLDPNTHSVFNNTPTSSVYNIMLYVGRTQLPDQSFEYEYNSLNVFSTDGSANHRWPHVQQNVIGKTLDLNGDPFFSDGFYNRESRSFGDGTLNWYILFFILDDRFVFNFPTAYASDIGKPCLFTSAVRANNVATPNNIGPQEANTIDGKIVIIDTIHQLMGPPKKMLRIWKSFSATAIERDELLLDWTFVAP